MADDDIALLCNAFYDMKMDDLGVFQARITNLYATLANIFEVVNENNLIESEEAVHAAFREFVASKPES